MRENRLFALVLAAVMVVMLFCGCEESYPTDSFASVVGTAPEGYLETLTSLEDCCD